LNLIMPRSATPSSMPWIAFCQKASAILSKACADFHVSP
jgi:hypothetical protein